MGREGQGGGRFPQVGAQAPFSHEGLVTKEPGKGPSKTDFRPRPEAPSCSQHGSRPCPSKARGSGAREEEGCQALQEAPPADLPSAGLGASCFTTELKFRTAHKGRPSGRLPAFMEGMCAPPRPDGAAATPGAELPTGSAAPALGHSSQHWTALQAGRRCPTVLQAGQGGRTTHPHVHCARGEHAKWILSDWLRGSHGGLCRCYSWLDKCWTSSFKR